VEVLLIEENGKPSEDSLLTNEIKDKYTYLFDIQQDSVLETRDAIELQEKQLLQY